MGWRNQIPFLLSLSYRIVCPDIIGFGRTAAPHVSPPSPNPTTNIEYYSFKRAASDIAELARQLNCPKIILGGHDWGGAIVYRVSLWYPDLISHIFSVCTPYKAPTSTYVPLEEVITDYPHWAYQVVLASGIVEERIKTPEEIKQFLNALYGGKGEKGEVGFSVREGPIWENLGKLGRTRLVGEEVLGWYGREYERNGVGASVNWYRNREVNFKDELKLTNRIINVPVLFIQGTKDEALPPSMSEGMDRLIPNLTRREVKTGHWALWEAPEKVNGFVGEWLGKVDRGERSNL